MFIKKINILLIKFSLSIIIFIVFLCYSHLKGNYDDGDFIAKTSPHYVYFSLYRIKRYLNFPTYSAFIWLPIIFYYSLAVSLISQLIVIFIGFFYQINKIMDVSIKITFIISWIFLIFAFLLQTNALICVILVFFTTILYIFNKKIKRINIYINE